MDEDDYLAITGRIKDMVIHGGENLHPREIEEFLCTHPGILDAQVNGVPVPDEVYGEELKTRPAQARPVGMLRSVRG
jgi:fatty-acyl-CoA synthase